MSRSIITITPFQINLFLGFTSLVLLATAFASQYLLGLQPCPLCLMQRWPYGIVIILSALGIVLRKKPKLLRSVLGVSGVALLAGAAIGGYQVGVEQGVFEGLAGCSENVPAGASIEDIRAAIFAASSVSCAEPAIVVMGLSMAGWNAVIGSVLGMCAIVIAGRKKYHYYA